MLIGESLVDEKTSPGCCPREADQHKYSTLKSDDAPGFHHEESAVADGDGSAVFSVWSHPQTPTCWARVLRRSIQAASMRVSHDGANLVPLTQKYTMNWSTEPGPRPFPKELVYQVSSVE